LARGAATGSYPYNTALFLWKMAQWKHTPPLKASSSILLCIRKILTDYSRFSLHQL
jgi:hypothetical protein